TNTLPFSSNLRQYRARGSAVMLQPGTKYYFQFGTGPASSITWAHYVDGTTWSETFPEDTNKVTIPSQTGVYVIPATGHGSASAYKVYSGWNGGVRNVVNAGGATTQDAESGFGGDVSHGIVVNASFVIIRG